jgi:hypothetical protein
MEFVAFRVCFDGLRAGESLGPIRAFRKIPSSEEQGFFDGNMGSLPLDQGIIWLDQDNLCPYKVVGF